MLYGVILESARDGIILSYGLNIWKRIVNQLELPSDEFDLFTHYNDQLLLNICDCLVDILHEGTRDTYLEYFGQDFFRYLKTFGYQKLFQIAGRTLRDFLFVIDQLHDSNRFTFPQMQSPSFHITDEDHTGVAIEYKSVRHGFIHFAIGSILGVAKRLFQEDNVRLYIRLDLSTQEYTHTVFWVQFDNRSYQKKSIGRFMSLPDVTVSTFFRVFPFSILMNSSLHIRSMGDNIKKLFPTDIYLYGRPFAEIFRLIRPDIHIEWDKILAYGGHIVFLIENRIPLRYGPSSCIRLKGHMKYLPDKDMLWFLCHPVLGSANDMISAGLYLTDLNLFDGTSELLIINMHQTREIENTLEKEKSCELQLKQVKTELLKLDEENQSLLRTILPKHIATMVQSGVQTHNLCQSYPLVAIMFLTLMDLKTCIPYLQPHEIIHTLDKTINLLNEIADKYDVFKMKTRTNASYMIVAGLHDQSNTVSNDISSLLSRKFCPDDDEQNTNSSLGLNATEIIAYLSCELLNMNEHLINPITRKPFRMKIGFHSGTAIGGLIGDQNLQYCLFGDTVTIARIIMSTGEPGRIHISQVAYNHLVENNRFDIEYRGQTEIKSHRPSGTYWLRGIHKLPSTTVVNKSTPLLRCPFSGKLL